MKIYLFLVSLSLLFIVACERKTVSEPKVSVAPDVVMQKNSNSLPVSATNESPIKARETGGIKVQESIKASSVSDGQSISKTITQALKEATVSTEHDLAGTVDHAREVTKSQLSGSRQRADKAENEMDDMLKNK